MAHRRFVFHQCRLRPPLFGKAFVSADTETGGDEFLFVLHPRTVVDSLEKGLLFACPSEGGCGISIHLDDRCHYSSVVRDPFGQFYSKQMAVCF